MSKNIQKNLPLLLLLLFTGLQSEILHAAGSSLLWKISGKGLKSPSYLFGTIHIIPAADFYMPESTETLLKSCKNLVMEMDISDLGSQMAVMGKMMMDSGKTLKDLYSAEKYRKMEDVLKKSGIPLEMLARFKPIMTQQMLTVRSLGKDTKSYEMHFSAIAKQDKIRVIGLETIDDQVAALNSIPVKKQADMLYESAMSPEKDKKNLAKLIKLYKKQDPEVLYKATMKDKKNKEFAEQEDALLVNRNKAWIPKLESIFTEGSTFVAVGAAHLGGPNGVIQLLKAAGYTLEPIHN